MAYSFQTYTVFEVLTSTAMNQEEINIRDHVHGVGGVSSAGHIFSAGSGTGTFGTAGLISVQTSATGVGNGADATDDTLFTYTLPANSLSADGKSVRIKQWGTFGSNLKRLQSYVGGSVVVTNSGGFNGDWLMDVTVVRIDSTHVSVTALMTFPTATTLPTTLTNTPNLAVSDLTANGTILKVTGASYNSSHANDVLGYGMTVEFLN